MLNSELVYPQDREDHTQFSGAFFRVRPPLRLGNEHNLTKTFNWDGYLEGSFKSTKKFKLWPDAKHCSITKLQGELTCDSHQNTIGAMISKIMDALILLKMQRQTEAHRPGRAAITDIN